MKKLLLSFTILLSVLSANAQGLQAERDTLKKTLIKSTSTKSGSAGGSSSGGLAPVSMPIMPSPTAASLVRNATASPNLYTGAVNVSVPLYTLPAQGMSIPIGLVYQSNGIKVNEKNGPLGMTWSLQGGGAVARIVRGYPDEFKGEITKEVDVQLNRDPRKIKKKKKKIKINGFWHGKYSKEFEDIIGGGDELKEYKKFIEKFTDEENVYDTEQDKYIFSAPGISGSFYVFSNLTVGVYCDKKVKVVCTSEFVTDDEKKIKGFTIKTEDGTYYEFGHKDKYIEEQSYSIQTNSTSTKQPKIKKNYYDLVGDFAEEKVIEKVNFDSRYRSVWYLKEIRTPYNAGSIYYNYESTEDISELQANSATVDIDDLSNCAIVNIDGKQAIYSHDEPNNKEYVEQNYSFSKTETTTYSPKRLSSIYTSLSNVTLTYNSNNIVSRIAVRKDKEPVKVYGIDYLRARAKVSEPSDKIFFTNHIYNSRDGKLKNYSTIEFDTELDPIEDIETLETRFFISDIYEVNSSSTDSINIFSFEYNKPEQLPQRGSNFQNSLGFYREYANFKECFISEQDKIEFDAGSNRENIRTKYHMLTLNGSTPEWEYNPSHPENGLLVKFKNATGAVNHFEYDSSPFGAFLTKNYYTDGNDTLQSVTYDYKGSGKAPYGVYSFDYSSNYGKRGISIWCGTEAALSQGSYYEFKEVCAKNNLGRTEYTFTAPYGDYNNQRAKSYFYDPSSNSIVNVVDRDAGRPQNRINLRGKPLLVKSYSNKNQLISETSYMYENEGVIGENESSFNIIRNADNSNDYNLYVAFNIRRHQYLRPTIVENTQFISSTQKQSVKTEYLKYDSDLFYYPSQIQQTNLNSGDVILTETKIKKLAEEHQHKPQYLPVKQEVFKNEKQISGSEVILDKTSRLALETKSWINGEYETTQTYDLFDDKARILQVHGKDDIPVSYRYKEGLIELSAENATYEQIKEGTPDELRENLPNSFISSVNYNDLGFVESKTDANSYSVYYEYDDFGRLKLTRDHDKNIVQAHDYQYGEVKLETVKSEKFGIGQMVIGESFVVGGFTETKSEGQSSAGKNYIASYNFKTENASYNDISNLDKASTTIEYQDGLGRAIQQIAVNALPQQYSLVQAFEYDSLGRQPIQFRNLPMLSDEKYKSNWKQYLQDKYETAHKAETIFDDFHRVHRQGGFGEDYQANKEHASITNYGVNGLEIKSYTIDIDSEEFQEKFYSIGSLLRTSVYHEGITAINYTDVNGLLIRKAVVQSYQKGDTDYGSGLITDYVYDDYGNVRAILPPQAKGDISKSEYVYKFLYDERNRLVKKEIPGAGSITMEYDELDRLIHETDAKGLTTYIKYDELSRPVETGYFSPQKPPLTPPEGGESATGGEEMVLSRTYYDNYDFNFAKANPCSKENVENNRGRVTGSETRVLNTNTWIKAVSYYDKEGRVIEAISQNNTGGIDKVTTAYDFEGKVTETKVSKSFKGKEYSSKREYDYGKAGELLNVHHGVNGQSTIALSSFSYNNDGSLAEKRMHNGKIKTNYTYDELDRMVNAQSDKLFELELAYDSALKGTNNEAQYDGSLSAMAWKTASKKRHTYSFNYDKWKNLSAANSSDHPYTTEYMYDANGNMNMLKRRDSLCIEPNDVYQHFEYEYEESNQLRKLWRKNTEEVEVWPGDANKDGKVEVDDQHPVGYNYQLRVRPRDTRSTEWKAFLTVQRKGDDLVFSDTNGDGTINQQDTIAIHQNLLEKHEVAEAKPTKPFSYEYDENGNMVYDEYKKLRISYNIFNLPDTLKVDGQGSIVNQYLADGTLLRRSFLDEDNNELKRIDYQGEFLFVNDQLDKIFTEEGYYQPASARADAQNSPPSGGVGGGNKKVKKSDYGTYYYTLKDHLGHTRVVIDEEENVIQETAYYPYGGIIAGLSTKSNYNYLYTGKEFIDSLGINWYDHHARYYDPEVGRWFAIDPALQAASPYMAMGNNPMMMVDEDGKTWGIFKGIGNAWDYAWDKGNQFARWADKNGIPAMSFGVGMSSGGQVNPVANVNGQELDLTGKAASINRGVAYANYSISSQRYDVKRKFPVVWAEPLIFNGAWTYDPNDLFSSLQTLEQVQFFEWSKQSSGRVEKTDSPIDFLMGAGIGKLLINGGRKLALRAAVKTVSRKTTVNGANSAYGGVRAASSYLQKIGVPRVYRKEILQSFDVGSITLRKARNKTYGLRFYGGAAEANGRYLFPTFTNYTSRTGLALPYKWNSMSGLRQFQIRPGSTYIYGRASSQGGIYSGGSYQMYLNNLDNLIP